MYFPKNAAILVLLLTVFQGCSKPSDVPSSEHIPEPGANIASKSNVDDGQADRLFKIAFAHPSPYEMKAPDTTRDGSYTYKPSKVMTYGEWQILISEATASDCHGCFGKLAIHYFKRVGHQSKLTGAWVNFASGEGWGKPPQWKVRTDLLQFPVLELRTYFGNNGYDCDWVSLAELTPEKPVMRISSTVAGYDDSGAVEDGSETTSAIVERGSGKNGIRLVYSGSHSASVDLVRVKGRYVAGRNPLTGRCAP